MTTSWTEDDVVTLEKALATGATKVRYADGREVQFRSLADLRATLAEVRAAVAPGASAPQRRVVAGYCSGL